MRRLAVLTVFCVLAAWVSAAAAAEPRETQGPRAPAVKKQQAVKPMKARPVEKPQNVGTREKLSATGYFDKDQDEPTQERPNPIDTKGVKDPAAATNPARVQSTPAPR